MYLELEKVRYGSEAQFSELKGWYDLGYYILLAIFSQFFCTVITMSSSFLLFTSSLGAVC